MLQLKQSAFLPNQTGVRYFCLAGLNSVLLLISCGCNNSVSAKGAVDTVPTNTPEAGVVLADCEGYICIPFKQVGMSEEMQVDLCFSSCECIQPRVVSYLASNNKAATAFMLKFIPENSQQKVAPANLGVVIDIKLRGGLTQQFTGNVVHTVLSKDYFSSNRSESMSQTILRRYTSRSRVHAKELI